MGGGSGQAWADAESIDLSVIRRFDVSRHGETVRLPAGSRRLLALLALLDSPSHRCYVAGLLWPEADDRQARASLRTALWRLSFAPHPLVEAAGDCLRLAPQVHVDLHAAVAYAERLLRNPEHTSLDDCSYRDLYFDLLPDWYEDWVAVQRERFRDLRVRALEAICRRMTAISRFAEAVQAGLAAVHAEPLRESSHSVLIEAHLTEGNFAAAVSQYERLRASLVLELGIPPSARLSSMLRPYAWTDRRVAAGPTP